MRPDLVDAIYLGAIGIFLVIVTYDGGMERLLHAGAGCLVGVLIARAHIAWNKRRRARR